MTRLTHRFRDFFFRKTSGFDVWFSSAGNVIENFNAFFFTILLHVLTISSGTRRKRIHGGIIWIQVRSSIRINECLVRVEIRYCHRNFKLMKNMITNDQKENEIKIKLLNRLVQRLASQGNANNSCVNVMNANLIRPPILEL